MILKFYCKYIMTMSLFTVNKNERQRMCTLNFNVYINIKNYKEMLICEKAIFL